MNRLAENRKRHPVVEALEGRQLLTVGAQHATIEALARATPVQPSVLGTKLTTQVGQIYGTVPSGKPGATVTVKVGLSVWNAIRNAPLLGGPITMSVRSGSGWVAAGTASANTYYTDSFG